MSNSPIDPQEPLKKPSFSAGEKAALKARIRAFDPSGPATLRQVRMMQRLTQKQVAERMGTEQDRVSRLERRADLRVSTLREYVAALGGSLRLVVDIPGEEPVAIRLPEPVRKVRTPRIVK